MSWHVIAHTDIKKSSRRKVKRFSEQVPSIKATELSPIINIYIE